MYLHALATALPEQSYSHEDCWRIIEKSPARNRLSRRSRLIIRALLRDGEAVAKRHFAVPEVERLFELGPDELNQAFRLAAPRLAGRALRLALERAGLAPSDLDALIICTCTGYLCPGLTSYVAEDLGLKPDTLLQDLVGLGCGAAIPSLRSASHVLAAHPRATIACVAVEICSAAFYLDDDPGVLISACLFGDGAAATIWRSEPGPDPLRCFGFQTVHLPAERDKIRFEMREGKLRNLLDRTVPELAAAAVGRLWGERGPRPVARIASHSGGPEVLEALAGAVPGHRLDASAEILRECGNLSSPTVLFVLERILQAEKPGPGGDFWLVSFGAGFSAHACRIGV